MKVIITNECFWYLISYDPQLAHNFSVRIKFTSKRNVIELMTATISKYWNASSRYWLSDIDLNNYTTLQQQKYR